MCKDTRFVEPSQQGYSENTQQNTGSLAQAAMLLAPPEGMAKLQEPFQHFLSRFLFGVLTSQLQQGIPIALWHSSLYTGICGYLHSFTIYYRPSQQHWTGMSPHLQPACLQGGTLHVSIHETRKKVTVTALPSHFLVLCSHWGVQIPNLPEQLLTAAVMFCSFCKHPPFSYASICHYCHQQFSAINGASS